MHKIENLASELNNMLNYPRQKMDNEQLVELERVYSNIFLDKCYIIPEFKLDQFGQIILEESNQGELNE